MNHPGHPPKKPTATTGLFALLCALLGVGGTRASKIIQGTSVSFLLVLITLSFTPGAAFAAAGHEVKEFKESFGAPGHEAGQFEDPTGVAVNNVTGDVYVVDKGNNRVDEFEADGTFIRAWGWGVDKENPEAKLQECTTATGCLHGEAGSGAGQFEEPEAIAIDNSGETAAAHPSVGDVYVTDHNVVDKFSSSGAYLGQIAGTCENKEGKEETPPSCSGFTAFQTVFGVAVDPKGVVWVEQGVAEEPEPQLDDYSDAASNAFLSSSTSSAGRPQPGLAVDSEDDLYVVHGTYFTLAKLNSGGVIIRSGQRQGNTGVAVEASSNDLYTDIGNAIQVYEPGQFVKEETPETFGETQLTDGGGTGLAVSYAPISSGDVYVVDSTENKVDIFTPPKVKVYVESFHFGGKGTGSGEFTEPLGIAVNDSTELGDEQDGDVYVVDKGDKRVEQFDSTGHEVALAAGAFEPPGGFNEPEDIAVDNCENAMGEPCLKSEDESVGDVYVSDRRPIEHDGNSYVSPSAVDKFSSTGTYLGQLRRCPEEEYLEGGFGCLPAGHPTAGFDVEVNGVAVGPEGNVWVGNSGTFNEQPYEFSDAEPNTFLESSKSPVPVTVSSALDPATGELFVDHGSSIDRYASGQASPTGLLETFGVGLQESQGIAVSPAGTVYATERTADDVKAFKEFPLAQVAVGALAELSPTSVTLQGSVNPEGAKVSSCEFEYGETTSYGKTAACEQGLGEGPGEIGKGTAPVLVSAKLSGLPSGTTYHYRLVASDVHGTTPGSDHVFTTPGPNVAAEQVTYIEAEDATLNAQIDPDGSQTSYHFEYDTSPYGEGEAAHGTSLPVPGAAIGAGTSPVPVSVKLTGLQAGKTYYYRAVAEAAPLGAPESFYGTGKTFTTNPTPGTEPPQICPNEQRRAEQPYGPRLPDCRAYEMVSPLETDGTDATDPTFGGESVSLIKAGYVRASEDKEQEAKGESATPAITYASEGSFAEPGGAPIQSQLLSRRNVQEGRWETRSISAPYERDQNTEGMSDYIGVFFTPELTEGLATTAAAGLSAEAPAGLRELYRASFPEDLDLHEPTSYRLVSKLPPSEEIYAEPYAYTANVFPLGASRDLSHVVFTTAAGEQSEVGPLREWVSGHVVLAGVSNEGQVWTGASVGSSPSSNLDGGGADVWRAVSEDGSRVIFNYAGEVYARVNVGVKAEPEPEREQSRINGQKECIEPAKACTVKLSVGAAKYWGANTEDTKIFYTENGDLYEYKLPVGAVKGQARDLTPGGEVQGVAQISEDGSYVYFVANAVLGDGAAHGATPGNCGVIEEDFTPEATGTACNLYVSHEDSEPVFIATLSARDGQDWLAGPGADTAALAPGAPGLADGARLAFTSTESLTGYDNEEAGPGECGLGENGKKCSEVYLYDAETSALVCASCNPSGARPVGPASLASGNYGGQLHGASNYRPRDLLADGELFFDSSDALVPHASDGRQNVYEYEGGHVYAISNVAGGMESFFLDASPDGQDVFFGSADQLLPEDTGNNVVVWDARQDGGFPVEVSPPACTTAEACRAASPPTPGIYGPPATATFAGPGNVSPPPPAVVKKVTKKTVTCKKGFVKNKKGKCIKKPKKKKNKARKSAHTNRRTR
jgi:hypothetical protein